MKKRYYCFFFVLFFVSCKNGQSQQPFLTVTYFYSEKSKDTHSTSENFSISGTTLAYTVKYTGRRGPSQEDESKTCTLSDEQVSSIRKAITDKQLNVTDSLIDNAEQAGSYQVTTGISVTYTNENKTSKIKIKGDPAAFGGKPLYKNSNSLLNMLRKMLKDCH